MLLVPADQMTPRERAEAFWKGEIYDRIPANALIFEHAAAVLGISVKDYHHSGRLMAKAQVEAFYKYGSDAVILGTGLTGIAETLGAEVAYPVAGTPYTVEPGVNENSDIDGMYDIKILQKGKMPHLVTGLEILCESVGKVVPIMNAVVGAFSNAANLMGTENFMRALYKNPEYTHSILKLVNHATMRLITATSHLDLQYIVSDPTASGSLVSPTVFREFALPYLRELCQFIIQHGARPPQLHICGKTDRLLVDMMASGAGLLSVDEIVDLKKAKEVIGGGAVLVGNVKSTQSFYLGTPDEMAENVKENILSAYDTPWSYILAAGCGIPLFSKPANVRAFVDAARVYGQFPKSFC